MENQFKLFNQGIFLRDTSIEDIDDYVIWNTKEVEWQDWDAPWEKGGINIEKLKSNLLQKPTSSVPQVRKHLEICTIDRDHIGWVSSYYINGNKTQLAIGIDIPSKKFRGQNIGESAFTLFISYLLKTGLVSEIYTQTWSGNNRMIRLAEKCGFEVIHREINYREVREKVYDDLTFKLNKELFWNRFKHLE